MKSLSRIMLAGFAATALLAACTAKATLVPTGVGPGPQASQQASSGPTSPPATAPPSVAATTAPTDPPQLASLINVEDYFEIVAAGEVAPPASGAFILKAQSQWNTSTRALVQTALIAHGDPTTGLSIADQYILSAVAAIGTPGERRAANTVTSIMATFFEACGSRVPNEMVVLDGLGRNIVIDDIDANWTQGLADVHSLQSTWAQVRAEVAAKTGGPAVASVYDADITVVLGDVTAKDTANTLKDVSTMQNDFDAMEQVF